jgi:hypothetical protein
LATTALKDYSTSFAGSGITPCAVGGSPRRNESAGQGQKHGLRFGDRIFAADKGLKETRARNSECWASFWTLVGGEKMPRGQELEIDERAC